MSGITQYLSFGVCLSIMLSLSIMFLRFICVRGAWVAQLVECPTLAQVMIAQFMGLSPTLGSVLTARSLEPASDSASLSLSAPLPLMLFFLSLSLSQK